MTSSNRRNLAAAGFIVLLGLCVAAFFVGKHAGGRKAAPLIAPPSTAPPSTAPPSAVRISLPPSSLISSASPESPGPTITLPAHTSVPLSTTGEDPAVLVPSR